MSADKLISSRILRAGLKALEARIKADAPFIPGFASRREERLLQEFRDLIKEAEREYLSTGSVAALTNWDPGTLRRYGRKAISRQPLPEEWAGLVVRREGKEFGFLLSSIPPKIRCIATSGRDVRTSTDALYDLTLK